MKSEPFDFLNFKQVEKKKLEENEEIVEELLLCDWMAEFVVLVVESMAHNLSVNLIKVFSISFLFLLFFFFYLTNLI